MRRAVHRDGPSIATGSVLGLFEPDALLKVQWDARNGGFAGLTPEKKLCLACLENVVDSIRLTTMTTAPDPGDRPRSYRDRRSRYRRTVAYRHEDRAWICSDEDRPYSLVYICQALGLDVGWVRAGLLALPQRIRDGQVVTREQYRRTHA